MRLRRGKTAVTPLSMEGKKIVTQMDRLTVYDMYAPFDSETWVLMGATTAQSLYAFSKRVSRMILLAIALMLIFDAAGSVLIARRLSKPIEKLSKEVDIARMNENGIPRAFHHGAFGRSTTLRRRSPAEPRGH